MNEAGRRLDSTTEVKLLLLNTYDFTDHCLSVSSDDFDAHWAWSGVCHGGGDGHRGDDEECFLHDE